MTTTTTRKVAIVTGGATGIGLATTRRLLADGHSVVIASRDEAQAKTVLPTLDPDRTVFVRTDVTDEASVEALMEATIDRFGRLDYLSNNAGVEGTAGPMDAWSADDVDAVLSVNVKGAFLCMKRAARVMEAGSVIVNISSVLGTIPLPLAAPYAASKAALLSLNRSVAAELEGRGISVFAICPGVVDTPMMDRVAKAAGAPKEALAEAVCPSRRLTSPDRIAAVVVGLFDGTPALETGSAVRVGPDTVEPITIDLTRSLQTV